MHLGHTFYNDSYPVANPILYPWETIFPRVKKQKRVLVVDDDADMVDLLKLMFKDDREIKIFTSQDPYEAMEMMSVQVFDFIILDWNLPHLNGLETLLEVEKGFKFDPNLPLEWDQKKVRVIVLSGNERESCKVTNTKHFRYSGYINKAKNAVTIASDLREYFKKVIL